MAISSPDFFISRKDAGSNHFPQDVLSDFHTNWLEIERHKHPIAGTQLTIATRAASQSIANNTIGPGNAVNVLFTGFSINQLGLPTPDVNGNVKIVNSGNYLIIAFWGFDVSAVGQREWDINVNGGGQVGVVINAAGGGQGSYFNLSAANALQAGDLVSCDTGQNSGGPLNVVAGARLMIQRQL